MFVCEGERDWLFSLLRQRERETERFASWSFGPHPVRDKNRLCNVRERVHKFYSAFQNPLAKMMNNFSTFFLPLSFVSCREKDIQGQVLATPLTSAASYSSVSLYQVCYLRPVSQVSPGYKTLAPCPKNNAETKRSNCQYVCFCFWKHCWKIVLRWQDDNTCKDGCYFVLFVFTAT